MFSKNSLAWIVENDLNPGRKARFYGSFAQLCISPKSRNGDEFGLWFKWVISYARTFSTVQGSWLFRSWRACAFTVPGFRLSSHLCALTWHGMLMNSNCTWVPSNSSSRPYSKNKSSDTFLLEWIMPAKLRKNVHLMFQWRHLHQLNSLDQGQPRNPLRWGSSLLLGLQISGTWSVSF